MSDFPVYLSLSKTLLRKEHLGAYALDTSLSLVQLHVAEARSTRTVDTWTLGVSDRQCINVSTLGQSI